MRRPDPGEGCAVALVASALIADYLLIRRGCQTISTCVRRGWVPRLVVLYLAAHLLFSLRFDPLTWLAGRVCPRRTT